MSDGPWIKFYPSDWLTGTRGLSAAEIGVYITLIAMMYERGEAIAFDVPRLARACGIPAASFTRILDELIFTGKVSSDGATLFNARVQSELVTRQLASVTAANSARARWGKDKQNQSKPDADAKPEPSSRDARQKSDTRYQKEHPTGDSAKAREPTPREILLSVLDEETADAVIKHRKGKRAALSTPLAARGLVKAFSEYPGGSRAAAEMMVTNGWTGFKREYWDRSLPRGSLGVGETAIEKAKRELAERIRNEHGIGREGGGNPTDAGLFPILIEAKR